MAVASEDWIPDDGDDWLGGDEPRRRGNRPDASKEDGSTRPRPNEMPEVVEIRPRCPFCGSLGIYRGRYKLKRIRYYWCRVCSLSFRSREASP